MLLLAACPSPSPEDEKLVVSGTLQGTLPEHPMKVVVLWWTETEQGDALYKFGAGTIQGESFSATITGPLPREARGDRDVGVGTVGLVPAALDMPDGLVDEELLEQAIGAAANEAVIWRAPDATIFGPSWAKDFPAGYSCGDCVPAPEPTNGFAFDEFTPGACNDLTLYVPIDETTPICNWS